MKKVSSFYLFSSWFSLSLSQSDWSRNSTSVYSNLTRELGIIKANKEISAPTHFVYPSVFFLETENKLGEETEKGEGEGAVN